MRPLPVRLLALAVAPLLVLSACGGDDESGPSSPSDIKVSGDFGESPKVDIPDGYSVDDSQTRVLSAGDGEEVHDGDKVLVQLAAYNGTTGEEIANLFTGEAAQPQTITVNDQSTLLPGLTDGIEGQTVGSRVLLSITPDDGFGSQGSPQIRVQPEDSIVAVVDLLPVEDAPKPNGSIDDVNVTGAPGSKPKVDFDAPLYVDKAQTKVITAGDGTVVGKDDTVSAEYVGVNGRTGKEFDSRFGVCAPSTPFKVSDGGVMRGFSDSLVGERYGSRIAIALPRDDGYGPAGNKAAGVSGTDTLVFVVDIEKPPEQPPATGTIDDVTASGKPGTSPKVTFDEPFFVDHTQSKILDKGKGEPLKQGDEVQVNYRGVNACTGEPFYDNYGRESAELVLDESKLLPGLVKGLVGKLPGSRVLIAMPRSQAYGETGNPQANITGTDTLVFVVDIAPAEGSEDKGSSD